MPADVGWEYEPGGVAILAEAPGACEDGSCKHHHDPAVAGRPMVGPAGKVLNSLLLEAGLSRSQVVVMNMVRCRPPNNKLADVPFAIDYCDMWLQAEMEAYQPSVVVVMGATSMAPVFGEKPKVGALAGHARQTGGRTYIATYHPAAALYEHKAEVRAIIKRDLEYAREVATDGRCSAGD